MSLLNVLNPGKKRISETKRILNLPVREPPNLDEYIGPDLTPEFSLGVSDFVFKPVQSWALEEIRVELGGVLAVGVGHGKTLIAYAACVVLGIAPEDVLVLVPANLRGTFKREGLMYAEHMRTPPELPIMSYAELSRPSALDFLTRTRPKLIICDEAHYLRSTDSTRTRRFARYLKSAPDTIFVAMSGTLFTSSIKDAQGLMLQALGEGAPVPRAYSTLEWWSACIDVPRGADASATEYDYKRISALNERFGTGEKLLDIAPSRRKVAVREAYSNRFTSTPGVIHTVESSAQNALYMQPIDPYGPSRVDLAPLIDEVESAWLRPDGEQLDSDLRVNEVLRMLALGYYMTWDWGEDGKNEEWNDTRLEYMRQKMRYLKRDRPGADSPYLVEQAIRRGLLDGLVEGYQITEKAYPDLVSAFRAWDFVKDDCSPTPVGVVVTPDIIGRVVAFSRGVVKRRNTRGIIWYAHTISADILELLGVRVYRPGSEPALDPPALGTVCAMSVSSHGTGKQLQPWADNFVLYPPSNGKIWEQLLGRTHRPGNDADSIFCYVCAHSTEHQRAVQKGREHARFIEAVSKQKQKMNLATWLKKKIV